jgi:stage V sporulation protein G
VEITEVRIKLMEDSDDRLQAFCSITFDNCFVVRDLKVIEGAGGPFVAMPSRKLAAHCPHCDAKNHLRAAYCNQCGGRLDIDRALRDNEGRLRLYADISHPISSACREMIQERVISEYRAEREQSKKPGYVSKYHEDYEDFDDDFEIVEAVSVAARAKPPVDQSTESAGAGRPNQRVQPAEVEPRAPHLAGKRAPKRTPHEPGTLHHRPGGEFGAGIF